MNDSTFVIRGRRREWPPAARMAAAITATAALALLAAACGGSPSTGSGGASNAGASASSRSAVAFSSCIRSNGVPSYPDPDSSGAVPKADARQLGVSSSVLDAAESACRHLLPTSSGSTQQQVQQCMLAGDCPQALVQQVLTAELSFARCMRSHGVPDWPDPAIDSEGRPVFPMTSVPGRDRSYWRSPQVQPRVDECQHLTGGSPVPFG